MMAASPGRLTEAKITRPRLAAGGIEEAERGHKRAALDADSVRDAYLRQLTGPALVSQASSAPASIRAPDVFSPLQSASAPTQPPP